MLGALRLQAFRVIGVEPSQGRCADAVREDAQCDRDDDGSEHDLRLGRGQCVDRNQAEDDGRQAAGSEPADEGDGGPIQAGAGESQRHRDHAHDRQGEDGEDEVAPVRRPQAGNQHHRTEGEPHEEREQRPCLLGEGESALALAEHRPEREPGDEGGHEPVGVRNEGNTVGEHSECQHGQRLKSRRAPTRSGREGEQDGAQDADGRAQGCTAY